MTHRVLVLGGDGMAGSMLVEYLSSRGHSITSTTRRKNVSGSQQYFDASDDLGRLDEVIADTKPDFVVNCIGILNQTAEDNHPLAVKVNSLLPQYVDSLSKNKKFKLIHISTDCVFSGNKGGYVESDAPDAETFYGRSKALGEVREGDSLTFRTSIVGPDPNEKGIGLFNWFMSQEGEIGGYSKAIWSGVTTLQLAKSVEESFNSSVSGLYHLVNNESIDKYNLLILFNKCMSKDIVIKPEAGYVNDKSIINTRTDVVFTVPSYDDMVKEMGEWINKHDGMFPNLIGEKTDV